MPKVKVYSTKICPWCVQAKEFFAAHKIAFEDIDVSIDKKAAQEMIYKSGQTGVPVIEIDSQIIVGFDREKVSKALGLRHEH